MRTLAVLVVALLVLGVALTFYFDTRLHRVDALGNYAGRVSDTPGTNWLMVGSDSRAGLSDAQKKALATGDSDGSRTDTIMLVHIPESGKAVMVSIPRDLFVTIPGQGQYKINAAFNFGGPRLLTQTVETVTHVHIDHYAEIGFGGFDSLVDAVGGVNICLDQSIRDPLAGINLRKGCQNLDGQQALGLVRTRAFPNADIERVINQRKFLGALMSKAASPSTLLNPFRLFPLINGAIGSLTVANGDHIWDLARLGWALHGSPISTSIPTLPSEVTSDGLALIPGDNTAAFFDHIAKDEPLPDDLIQNAGGALG
ncbi:transcriptional attenuator, LytR family [Williamsia sterculiae]|uniref:Transcriptional attenuator, LytR family n=1 Tax=Williamsia sterculiae TaxID=1344003 RepID=A0A1N7H9I4_9NOCA|nr:transcriptional attenuator, LytR family [Williamsia sterculiae]